MENVGYLTGGTFKRFDRFIGSLVREGPGITTMFIQHLQIDVSCRMIWQAKICRGNNLSIGQLDCVLVYFTEYALSHNYASVHISQTFPPRHLEL